MQVTPCSELMLSRIQVNTDSVALCKKKKDQGFLKKKKNNRCIFMHDEIRKKVFTFTYLQNAVTSFVVEISIYLGRAQTQPLERINVVSLQTDSDKDSVDGNTGELTVTGNDVTRDGVSGPMVTGTTDIPSLPTEPL